MFGFRLSSVSAMDYLLPVAVVLTCVLALELAKEYQMYDWVRALLDPTDIVQSPSSAKKQITPPPRFDLPPIEAPAILTASSTRLRRGRSASPSKKLSSPRKPRQTRAMKEANAAATSAANASLQSSLDLTASTVETESVTETVHQSVEVDGDEKPAPSPKKVTPTSKTKKIAARMQPSQEPGKEEKKVEVEEEEEEKVQVDVETNAESVDDIKTTQTTVSVEMPVTLPEAPSAADTEQMIAKAKEMVQEAVKLQTETAEPSSAKAAKKRKTEVLSEDEEEEDEETKTLRVKRAKVLEEKLKQERVRNRALVGVTAAFALA